jgi:hypothetical protein
MLTAQPSAIANVAPVHTFFMRYLPNVTLILVQSQRHVAVAGMFPSRAILRRMSRGVLAWRVCKRNWAE